MQEQPNSLFTRSRILILVSVILLGFAIVSAGEWVDHFLHTGKIVVSTTGKITVTPLGNTIANNTTSKSGTNLLTVSVRDGAYFVSASSAAGEVDQYVTITSHKTLHLNLTIPVASAVEPVSYGNFSDVSVDSSHLSFLDYNRSGINYVNTSNMDTYIPGTQHFLSVEWASPEYGVGFDKVTNDLFVIHNGTATILPSVVPADHASAVTYAVAPNHTIYIGLGNVLYEGTDQGVYKQVYTKLPTGAGLVAGNDGIAIVSAGYGTNSQIIYINNADQVVTKNFSATISGWSSWSPGDKYLAVVVGSQNEIFNTALQQVATIPQTSLTPFSYASWLNDNVLIYAIGNQLWEYNLAQQKTQIIGNIPTAEQVLGISVAQDGSYVYVVVANSTTTLPSAIMRVGLQNQTVPENLLSLNAANIFPLITPDYVGNLLNFSNTPTVLLTTTFTPAEASDSSMIQSANLSLESITETTGINFTVQRLGQ